MPEEQRVSPPTPIICQSSSLCKLRETHLHIYAFPSDVDSSLSESLLNQHLERNVSRKWPFRTKAHVFPFRPQLPDTLFGKWKSFFQNYCLQFMLMIYTNPSKNHSKIAQRKFALLRGCSVINQLCVLSYIHVAACFS